MNVNQKIWLSFGTVLALVGVGSALSYVKSRDAERTSTQLATEYFAEYRAAKSADEAISMARIHEQRFVASKNEAEVALAKAEVEKVKTLMADLQTVSSDAAHDADAAKASAAADVYFTAFSQVHQLMVRRGLKPELGLEGELRKAVHAVETGVKELNRPELTVTLLMARRHEKDYLLRGDPAYLDQLNTRIKEFSAQMVAAGLSADQQKQFSAQWTAYGAAMKTLVEGDAELKRASEVLLREGDAVESAIGSLAAAASQDIDTAQASTLGQLASGRKTVLGIGLASGVIGGLMAVWVALSLGALNRGIRTAAEAIDHGSGEIFGASTQLSQSSASLASGSSEQAASLEETSASLEELSSMTKRNADSAARAKDIATQTRAAADSGAARMDQMKQAMDDIKASSHDISKIIKTIDEIAFQTNILALNAAVEAARAGEAGMGFAVVADEVRNLAQRAAQSARETADKIETSVAKSENGVTISNHVAQSLAEIVAKAREVDVLVAEIAQASTEQSQGIGQVNTAVSQMDKITQVNAAAAEESAAAAQELNAQTAVLKGASGDLLAIVGGRRETTGAAAPARATAQKSPVKVPGLHTAAKTVHPPSRLEPAAVDANAEFFSNS